MNKKILISLSVIGLVAAVAIGGTIAYFNDTETSTGNIFVAGSIDLKVDHLAQTYNTIDCKTCSATIKSDTSDMVVSTVGGDDPVPMPHAAVAVSQPNSAWTVTNDIPGATWIWATDPVTTHDAGNVDVYYTFRKTFEWYGPISGATLSLGVGTDNGYEVKLNGHFVGNDWGEYNYRSPADTYPVGAYFDQGINTLEIQVKNQKMSGGTPAKNPAGLLYKLTIDGNCGTDYFKTHCTLFGEKDLVPGEDYFWRFEDVKPGDHGTNVISLHVDNNDAYVCLINDDIDDQENVLTETEAYAGDISDVEGELSDYLELFIWNDSNGDGVYNPTGEVNLYEGDFIPTEMIQLSLTSGGSDYLGVAWCLGNQTVSHTTGEISCSGSGNQDKAQTDKLLASLILYAEQQRNNSGFDCATVTLP